MEEADCITTWCDISLRQRFMIRIFSSEDDFQRAEQAAHLLKVPVEICEGKPLVESGFFLWSHSARLELGFESEGALASADLNEVDARIKSGKKSHLSRSIGIDKHGGLKVLDAMAGFGLDAMVMMGLGCEVQLVERSQVMHVLLRDALDRFSSTQSSSAAGVECGDVVKFIKNLTGPPKYDVIYLDPMFALRKKNALPNRRAQLLVRLVDSSVSEQSLVQLIKLSQRKASMRVVLKRRRTDPVALKPDWQIRARTVRFDVYRGLGEV